MSDWELRVSQKDVHRMHVVRLTLEGRETVGRAAKLLGISPRQMKRLRRKMKERGVEGLLHGNRGEAACGAGHDFFTAAMFIEGAINVVSLPLTVFQCLEWRQEDTEVFDSTLLFY